MTQAEVNHAKLRCDEAIVELTALLVARLDMGASIEKQLDHLYLLHLCRHGLMGTSLVYTNAMFDYVVELVSRLSFHCKKV